MPTPTGKHIFISYVREDLPWVKKLAHALEAKGEKVWFDVSANGITPGGEFKREIKDAIDQSYAFILCCSHNLAKRVQAGIYPESDLALKKYNTLSPGSKYFFPVRFDESEVPKIEAREQKYIGEVFQVVDLHRNQFSGLLRGIRQSPLRPDMSTTPTNDEVVLSSDFEFKLNELFAKLTETANIKLLFLYSIGFLVAVFAAGPLIQKTLDAKDPDLHGVGTSIGILGWFAVLLSRFFLSGKPISSDFKSSDVAPVKTPEGQKWQRIANKQYGEKMRLDTRRSVLFLAILGAILTSTWTFLSTFVISLLWEPKFFLTASITSAFVGSFCMAYLLLYRFVREKLFCNRDKFAIASGMVFLPLLLWILSFSPEALSELWRTEQQPNPFLVCVYLKTAALAATLLAAATVQPAK